jgi:hypothetical protein
MQKGKLATFAAGDEIRSVTITDAHIKALMDHAGSRSIVSHLTHDWYNSIGKPDEDTVEMSARIGALRNFRIDEQGDLSADFVVMPGEHREMILFGALNTPEDNMISVVFSFAPDDPNCIPRDFQAADLVPEGAGTYALFKNATLTNENKNMTPEEFKACLMEALKDPEVSKLLVGDDEETGEMEDYAAMEDAAGITDADKKKEDDQKPALMRLVIRSNRAMARMRKSLDERETEIISKAQAKATEVIGKSPLLKSHMGAVKASDEFEAAVTAQMSVSGNTNRGAAMARVRKDKPELYNAYMKSQEQKGAN